MQLLSIMRIYLVIFIAQLESTTLKTNLYNRTIDRDLLSIEKKNSSLIKKISLYEIERLLNKRVIKNEFHYLVK